MSFWRKCIVCKKEISFSTKYYKCSISSCDKKRSPAQFCSVECWDVHRSIMSHKSAWAEDFISPSQAEAKKLEASESQVRIVRQKQSSDVGFSSNVSSSNEILVVVSKLKQFVKEQAGLNTSADVSEVLSDFIREECLSAVYQAKKDGRKTLMGKDFLRK